MNFIFDPIVLTIPESTDKADINRFVEQINIWSQEVIARRHSFFVSGFYIGVLVNTNRYPEVHTLQPIWEKVSVPVLDIQTISSVCRGLLKRLPYFEDHEDLQNIIGVNAESVRTIPDLDYRFSKDRDIELFIAFREMLGYVAYAKEKSPPLSFEDLSIATHPISNTNFIEISAEILKYDGDMLLTSSVPLITNPNDLLQTRELNDIWQNIEPKLKINLILMAETLTEMNVLDIRGIDHIFYKHDDLGNVKISDPGKLWWMQNRKQILGDSLLSLPNLIYERSFIKDFESCRNIYDRLQLQSTLIRVSLILVRNNGNIALLKAKGGIEYENYTGKRLWNASVGHFRVSDRLRVNCIAESNSLILYNFGSHDYCERDCLRNL